MHTYEYANIHNAVYLKIDLLPSFLLLLALVYKDIKDYVQMVLANLRITLNILGVYKIKLVTAKPSKHTNERQRQKQKQTSKTKQKRKKTIGLKINLTDLVLSFRVVDPGVVFMNRC